MSILNKKNMRTIKSAFFAAILVILVLTIHGELTDINRSVITNYEPRECVFMLFITLLILFYVIDKDNG